MSGGLDSALAVKLIHDLGIQLLAIHFAEPICSKAAPGAGETSTSRAVCGKLGIEYRPLVIGQEYLDMLVAPKHGYGRAFNPCTDCHTLMLIKARQLMDKEGASFVVTGEVLGQRPMSQMAERLKMVEKDSGLEGLLLRPLSAKLLLPTIPETEGWVDREKLFGISGRSRKEQLRLAAEWGIVDFTTPAGGCLLTDPSFARILRDHLKHGKLLLDDVPLLKVGRHFRLAGGGKAVVGKDHVENERLVRLRREEDAWFYPVTERGPSALLRGGRQDEEALRDMASIVATYSGGEGPVTIRCEKDGQSVDLEGERKLRTDWDGVRV